MKLGILGAGKQAAAILHDFVNFSGASAIGIADSNGELAKSVAEKFGDEMVSSAELKVTANIAQQADLVDWLKQYDAVISALPYSCNAVLPELAIEAKTHITDLGGSDKVVEYQFAFHEKAKRAGITIMPDLGLAPGMAGLLGYGMLSRFDNCESLDIRVGGLPVKDYSFDSINPLDYNLSFSVSGLINEYIEDCQIIRGGEHTTVPGLSGLEDLRVQPFGALEAFYTSGGISTLAKTLDGKINHLTYKTIRYPGHCEKIQLLQSLGFFDSKFRRSTEMVLEEVLNKPFKDVIIMKNTVSGFQKGVFETWTQEMVEYGKDGLSAMARCTGFPAAIITAMIAEDVIDQCGALRQEDYVDIDMFKKQLEKRDIKITEKLDSICVGKAQA